MDMDVALFVEIGRNTQALRAAAHHRQSCGDGFGHHVAQRTGFGQLALTGNDRRLDSQQFATDLGPGQTSHLADLILLLGQSVTVLANTEIVLERFGGDLNRKALLTRVLLHGLAADLGELALEAAHTSFAGVVTNDVADGRFVELQFALLEAVGLGLLGREVFDRDIDLLVLGVTRQPDHFHAIQQRGRNVHGVGGAEEHHIREVVVDFQIVVVEVVVLLGIKHFQQCRCRITAHVTAHLVDFIEKEQRVAHADLGHLLDQTPRHGADVSTAVAADLGLVTHPTQSHAHELAVGGTSDGLGQRGLADAGRSNQAKHRALDLFNALLHGEVFKDTFLDLFQAVVVGIEDILGLCQIQANLALGLPRHIDQPIDVGTHHGRFSGHRRHLFQLVQFGGGLGQRFLGQASVVDTLLQLLDFVVTFVDIAELFLNGLHLLIQVVLALAALHLLFDAATDSLLDLQQVDLCIQQSQDMLDALGKFGQFEDFLLLLDLQCHVSGHGVHQAARLIDAVQRRKNFGGHFLAQLYVLFELAEQATNKYFGLALTRIDLLDQADLSTAMAVNLDESLNGTALLALDQHLHGAVRQFEQLQHGGDGTHAIQGIFSWIVIGRVLLGNQEDLLVPRHCRFESLDGFLAPYEQRDDHVRINHDIAQWQER
ncbi:hypothetical protein D9M69_328910 [compost metagenome]